MLTDMALMTPDDGRAYGTIYTERDVKSISVKGSAFYDEFF